VHPVFVGSAITGAGVGALMAGLAELLPVADGDPDGPVSGSVFKIERGPTGEKIAYVRLFSGTVRVRDRLEHGPDGAHGKVTGLAVVEGGGPVRRQAAGAGQIAMLRGLPDVLVGDPIGEPRDGAAARHFAPPTLETVVVPATPAEGGARDAERPGRPSRARELCSGTCRM
jgi:ribosomal protection tetracycline resistance protein